MPNRSTSLPLVYMDVQSCHISPETQIKRAANSTPPVLGYELGYLHYHTMIEIGYCVKGRGVCRVDNAEYPFKEGDGQLIYQFQPHLAINNPGESSVWEWEYVDAASLFKAANLDVPAMLYAPGGKSGIITDKEGSILIQQFIKASRDVRQYWLRDIAASLMKLLIYSKRSEADIHLSEKRPGDVYMALSPAMERVMRDLNEGRMSLVSEMAEDCHMSVSTFRRIFGELLEMSPRDYLRVCAIRKAQRLLADEWRDVSEVASACGYTDTAAFDRCFKRLLGMSPSEFRKTMSESGEVPRNGHQAADLPDIW